MVELTITIKGEDSTYKQKFLVYEEFKFVENDPVLLGYVKEALENSKIDPEDVKIRALLQL